MPYYYLGGLISPLDLEKRPDISWREFQEALELHLSPQDKNQMYRVLRYFDLENLRLYLRKAPLNRHGRLDENEFQSLFIEAENLEPWWETFLEKRAYKDTSGKSVSELEYAYFAHETTGNSAASLVLAKLWKSHWMAAYVRLDMKLRTLKLSQEPGYSDERAQQWIAEFDQGMDSLFLESLKAIWSSSATLEEVAKNYIKWQITFLNEGIDSPFELEALLTYLIQLAWVERYQEKNSPRAFNPKISAQKALGQLEGEMKKQAILKKG